MALEIKNQYPNIKISGLTLKGTSNPTGYFIEDGYWLGFSYYTKQNPIKITHVKPTWFQRQIMEFLGFTWIKF